MGFRNRFSGAFALVACLGCVGLARAEQLWGYYLEARTCQVYTGPCFANGEVGLAGKDAVMAWSIKSGGVQGEDLRDLNVVVVVEASDTLGFYGIDGVDAARSIILVDNRATPRQRDALVHFARQQSGKAGHDVRRIHDVPISIELNTLALSGRVQAGDWVNLVMRKANPGDCICSNEAAYYPPLTRVEHFAPGVTTDGKVTARGLGRRWTIPDSRSAYLATFAYN